MPASEQGLFDCFFFVVVFCPRMCMYECVCGCVPSLANSRDLIVVVDFCKINSASAVGNPGESVQPFL